MRIELVIRGQPPRKSNSREIVRNRRTGKWMVIKSKAARKWMADAIKQVPTAAKLGIGSAEHPLKVTYHVFYASRRPDLSTELIKDMLEAAGVISNDRHIYQEHAYKFFDKHHPRVHVVVEPLPDSHGFMAPVAEGLQMSFAGG